MTYNELKYIINCIKEYSRWHIDCITSDINDYIDDDCIGNKYIIDDFKEEREHWKDVYKMCEGNFQLYMSNFIFSRE